MKKILIWNILFLLLLGNLWSENTRRQAMQQIYQSYNRQEYTESLKMIEKALKNFGSDDELLKLKYKILMTQHKYQEALEFINAEIKTSGESNELLAAKYNVLFVQGNLPEALTVARKKYQLAKLKSPWDCMNIMHVYLRMGNLNDAIDWLKEAVKNGFISYRILDDKKYTALEKDPRFFEIIEEIKMSIGLGYPAKKFTAKLLSGQYFSLHAQRGKVVLLYFWATWCDPCCAEILNLNQFYREFKDKGFEMVSVNLDTGQTGLNRMKEFIEQNKLGWKHIYSGIGWSDDTVKLYGVNSLPSLWIIDKKGILRSFDVKGEELRNVIATLIAE